MRRITTPVVVALWTLLLGFGSAAAQEQGSYRVGPKDVISIKVFEEPAFDTEVRVSEEGTVRLLRVGDVKVEGLTVSEVGAELKRRLEASFLQRASVTVDIVAYRSRPISVIGAVRTPGSLDFSGRMTLIEAITAAGGLAPEHGKLIYVLRRANNGLTDQISIPVDDLLVRADPVLNIPIFANDLINVQATVELTVYCIGEVKQPGALTFKSTERLTLLAAVARAGGLTDRASKRILVRRADGRGELRIDFQRILDGKEPDVVLEEGDAIVVKESFF